MKTILYINDEHCTSIEQLKSYFSQLEVGSVFEDMLDYGRHGDITAWLREVGESALAERIESIGNSHGDRDFVNAMSEILLGNGLNERLVKKPYKECFSIEGASINIGNEKSVISLSIKVFSGVNESYEIKILTNWGTKAKLFNPSEYDENRIHTIEYEFHKRPGKEFGEFHFSIEKEEVNVECTEHFVENGSISMEKEEIMVEEGAALKSVRSVANGISFTIGVSFTMIKVKGGTFQMGAQNSNSGGDNYDSDAYGKENPVHSVTLSDYYIGETLVTQELWTAVMGVNPSRFKYCPQRPVENVSWNDCQTFIEKLNQLTGKNFRLPTEAEWEYAARARGGNKSKGYKYSGSDTLDDVAWNCDNSGYETHDVKTKQANELGIYDMSGNVWEWCQDFYGDYYNSELIKNPTGPSSGSKRVLRGGSCDDSSSCCRVSNRYSCYPDSRSYGIGFRLILQ